MRAKKIICVSAKPGFVAYGFRKQDISRQKVKWILGTRSCPNTDDSRNPT